MSRVPVVLCSCEQALQARLNANAILNRHRRQGRANERLFACLGTENVRVFRGGGLWISKVSTGVAQSRSRFGGFGFGQCDTELDNYGRCGIALRIFRP